MKLLSWNVAGRRGENLTAQRKHVVARGAEIVALQEVTGETYAPWCAGLAKAGYSVVSSVDLVGLPYPPPLPPGRQLRRRNFNVTASRLPIALLPGLSFPDPAEARVAFPEKFVAPAVVLDETTIEVHNAHIPPGSSRGIIKHQAFNAIRRRVDRCAKLPQLLCGDFNTPSAEDDDGVTTWAYRRPKIAAATCLH
jgi:endonuclease/exonuclease/phosphatase family metal-dependent hydrolase